MSDKDLLEQAFAAGAHNVTIMEIGKKFHATLHAWREIDGEGDVRHTEHATASGEGSTASIAMREALAKLRPTPAIEVTEIKAVGGRKVVPLALAEATTRIKGLSVPEPVVDEPEESPVAEPEPEQAEAG